MAAATKVAFSLIISIPRIDVNIQKLVWKQMKFMAVSKLEVTGMLDELLVESRMIVYADRVA